MEGLKLNIRIGILAAITIIMSFVAAARLYELQIVKGDSYYRQSEKKITRSVEVEANRGEILDRYGRKLVTSRLSYNISFDWTIMPEERRNEIIVNMIRLCGEKGVSYTNTLPIAYDGNDYAYSSQKDSVEAKRFAKYLKALGWPENLTAADVVAKQREEYGVDPTMSAKEALALCGVRYELDLRSARIGLNIPSYVFCEDVNITFIGIVKERTFPASA